jgi:hypothetical protein
MQDYKEWLIEKHQKLIDKYPQQIKDFKELKDKFGLSIDHQQEKIKYQKYLNQINNRK